MTAKPLVAVITGSKWLLNLKIIILGASSGIGRATALHFAKNNYKLSLSGRKLDALNELMKETNLSADSVNISIMFLNGTDNYWEKFVISLDLI